MFEKSEQSAFHAATGRAKQLLRAEHASFHQFNGMYRRLSARSIWRPHILRRSIVQNYIELHRVPSYNILVGNLEGNVPSAISGMAS